MLTTTCPHCQQTIGLTVLPLSVNQTAFALEAKGPREVIEMVCAEMEIPSSEVLGGRRSQSVVQCRRRCVAELAARWPRAGTSRLAAWLHVSVSTISLAQRGTK